MATPTEQPEQPAGIRKSSRFHYSDPSRESDWINQAFLLPDSSYDDDEYRQNRFASSADTTYVDSSPGGGIGCNVKPQYTPTADIRRAGRPFKRPRFTIVAMQSETGYGAGRIWNEYIHDPSQRIYVRCGVPEHNSLANFLRKAFTYEEITMAKRGTAPSWLYDVAKGAGAYIFARAFPIATMAIIVFQGLDFLLSRPNNRYCTLKPVMHQYWGMVNTMANTWAVNRGIMPKALKTDLPTVIGRPYQIDTDIVDAYAKMFPGFFVRDKGDGDAMYYYIDAFAFANRAQRVANIAFVEEFKRVSDTASGKANVDGDNFLGYIRSRDEQQRGYLQTPFSNQGDHTLRSYLNNMMISDYSRDTGWLSDANVVEMANRAEISRRVNNNADTVPAYDVNNPDAQMAPGTAEQSANTAVADPNAAGSLRDMVTKLAAQTDPAEAGKAEYAALASKIAEASNAYGKDNSLLIEPKYYTKESNNSGWWQNMTAALDAEFRSGSGYAVYCVESTGPVTESFSANYGESILSAKLNDLSSTAKQFRFSMADGNIFGSDNPITKTISGFVSGVGEVLGGVAESVTLGASNLLLGLAGSGYLDIPKHWLNSDADIPTMNYTMTLIAPSGNAMSQLQNIYIPLFMKIAEIVPRATGRSSYTYPFVTALYHRGHNQTQYGAMRSLTVTRGTSNLPFTVDGKALALELSFSYIDLTGITTMPVGGGAVTSMFSGAGIDDDTRITDYLAVLAGQDLYSQVYSVPRAMKRLAKVASRLGNVTSPAMMASFAHDKLINGGGLFNITKPFVRLYEMGLTSNNALVGAGASVPGTRAN